MLSNRVVAQRHHLGQYRLALVGGEIVKVDQERLGEDNLRLVVG
jgi:hypothetical protein